MEKKFLKLEYVLDKLETNESIEMKPAEIGVQLYKICSQYNSAEACPGDCDCDKVGGCGCDKGCGCDWN